MLEFQLIETALVFPVFGGVSKVHFNFTTNLLRFQRLMPVLGAEIFGDFDFFPRQNELQ